MLNPAAHKKLIRLKAIIKDMGSVLVAFSGGADSTFLLKVSSDILGKNCSALTAKSPTYLESELKEAEKLAREFGVRHIVVDSNELLIPGFAENPVDRCYLCKTELFEICLKKAKELGIKVVLDGTNSDDERDYRPGSRAREELGVRSPLKEANITKADVRILSKELDIPTWDKPNLACLSSRFPYGTEITLDRLDKIKASEDYLKSLGFKQLRVRYHGEIARIEVEPESMKSFLDNAVREKIVKKFTEIGFTYVTLDLLGYRCGSMNEPLRLHPETVKS